MQTQAQNKGCSPTLLILHCNQVVHVHLQACAVCCSSTLPQKGEIQNNEIGGFMYHLRSYGVLLSK